MRATNVKLFMGIISLPAILLQNNLIGIVLQTIYVIVLSVTSGRKFRVLPNLILLFSVSSAHLLQPNGLLLFTIGSFSVTLGALLLGARKALALIALLYLSHYMVTGKPQFPGKLGRLISLQFFYFDAITTKWRGIAPKRPFILAIDKLLHTVSEQSAGDRQRSESAPAMASAIDLARQGVHVVVLWGLFLAGSLHVLPVLI